MLLYQVGFRKQIKNKKAKNKILNETLFYKNDH